MHLDIQKNNKEIKTPKLEHKCEKIKKILKYLSGTGVAGFIFAIAAKLIYDKIHQNKIDKVYNELVIDNDVTLSVADQVWIKKNMILFAQQTSLCFHNAFMQLLACPEIRGKNYKSRKIMTMIEFINRELDRSYNGDSLCRKVEVPKQVRQIQDDYYAEDKNGNLYLDNKAPNKSWLNDGRYHNYLLHNKCWYKNLCFDGIPFEEFKIVNNFLYFNKYNRAKTLTSYDLCQPEKIKKIMSDCRDKPENFSIHFSNSGNERIIDDINCLQEYFYFPTFIVIYDGASKHYHCCYIVYDKDKNIKYFLWGDGMNKGFEIISKNDSLKKLTKYGTIYVKYSRYNIVKKYYTPELMYNAN